MLKDGVVMADVADVADVAVVVVLVGDAAYCGRNDDHSCGDTGDGNCDANSYGRDMQDEDAVGVADVVEPALRVDGAAAEGVVVPALKTIMPPIKTNKIKKSLP